MNFQQSKSPLGITKVWSSGPGLFLHSYVLKLNRNDLPYILPLRHKRSVAGFLKRGRVWPEFDKPVWREYISKTHRGH